MKALLPKLLLAYVAGAGAVFSFAPFYAWPLMLVSLVVLFTLWHRAQESNHAHRAKHAAAIGFAWGLGLFTVGVPWLFVSLHTYGGMPAWMAALAIFLFCAYLSLFPMLAGWVQAKFRVGVVLRLLILIPALFVAAELLRGWFMSGFPWLTIGYTQTPNALSAWNSAPMAGFGALIGVFGISFLLAFIAGAMVLLVQNVLKKSGKIALSFALVLVVVTGLLLERVQWSEPTANSPFPVSLLQGNVPQSLKFREDQVIPTVENYLGLVSEAKGQLIVLPETAFPFLLEQYPKELVGELRAKAIANQGDVLVGVALREKSNGPDRAYDVYNAAVSFGTSPSQRYAKSHLVAFGEFTPPLFAWVMRYLNMPLSGFTKGAETQASMRLSGHLVAVNICYEDAFGRGIANAFSVMPKPELMVNVTNMAWFGETWAADQHAQMSQMRAIEMSRWMLRATNTGVTAAIDEKGRIVKMLPQWQRGVLEVDVIPHHGITPYARFRDWPVLLFLALALAWCGIRSKRAKKSL